MEKSKNKRKRITEIILVVAIILCIGLVVVEVANNLSNEIVTQTKRVTNVEEVEPTPLPTLTTEQIRDSLSEPVGEEGNE